MSRVWNYDKDGQWLEMSLTVNGKTEDWTEDDLRRAGYEPSGLFFHALAEDQLTLWRHHNREDVLIELCLDAVKVDYLSCDSLPAYLRFLNEIALPLLGRIQRIDSAIELSELGNRAFEAWHGHALWDPCNQCDRQEMKDRLARRRQAEQGQS
jgi:hypothetical protein